MYTYSDIYYSEKEYVQIDFSKLKQGIINSMNKYFPCQETCDFGSIISFSYQDHLISISDNGNINTFYNNINTFNLLYLKLNLIENIFKEELKDFSIIDEFGNKIVFKNKPLLVKDNCVFLQSLAPLNNTIAQQSQYPLIYNGVLSAFPDSLKGIGVGVVAALAVAAPVAMPLAALALPSALIKNLFSEEADKTAERTDANKKNYKKKKQE